MQFSTTCGYLPRSDRQMDVIVHSPTDFWLHHSIEVYALWVESCRIEVVFDNVCVGSVSGFVSVHV